MGELKMSRKPYCFSRGRLNSLPGKSWQSMGGSVCKLPDVKPRNEMKVTHVLTALLLTLRCLAQTTPAHQLNFVSEPKPVVLWEHGAPGALGTSDQDTPTITAYFPLDPARTGTAVV